MKFETGKDFAVGVGLFNIVEAFDDDVIFDSCISISRFLSCDRIQAQSFVTACEGLSET